MNWELFVSIVDLFFFRAFASQARKDHLGSVGVIRNATGTTIEQESGFNYPYGGERVITAGNEQLQVHWHKLGAAGLPCCGWLMSQGVSHGLSNRYLLRLPTSAFFRHTAQFPP